MNIVEVRDGSLNTSFSAANDVFRSLVAEGVHEESVAFLSIVPLCHAGIWENKYPPKTVCNLFAPYAKQLLSVLNAPYIIATSPSAMDMMQRGMDPDARKPDLMMANMFDKVNVSKGYSPRVMRLEHTFAIQGDEVRSRDRVDAIKRTCEILTPTRQVRDAFAVLMRQAQITPNSSGGLQWALLRRVGFLSFPTEAELGNLTRFKISLLLNLTTRALKGRRSKSWSGKEEMSSHLKGFALYDKLEQMMEAIHGNFRIAFVCATGVRECVYWVTALRIFLMHSVEPLQKSLDWGMQLRRREISLDYRSQLTHFSSICTEQISTNAQQARGTFILVATHRTRSWAVRRMNEKGPLMIISEAMREMLPEEEHAEFSYEIKDAAEVDPGDVKWLDAVRWQKRVEWAFGHVSAKRRMQNQ